MRNSTRRLQLGVSPAFFSFWRRLSGAVLALCALTVADSLAQSPREAHRLEDGWAFHLGDVERAQENALDDSAWSRVTLPHDWSIGLAVDEAAPAAGGGGFFPTGIGWYRRVIDVPASWSGRRIAIEFEGAYMNSEVWINGVRLGNHPYGYTPFSYDLTRHLKPGEKNVLSVRVDNSSQPNSRWYSGSGLYRHVWLRVSDPVHVDEGKIFVSTAALEKTTALVDVSIPVRNEGTKRRDVTVELTILDGKRVVATSRIDHDIAPGRDWMAAAQLTVSDPRPWSPESPALYQLVARLTSGKTLLDETVTTFGIRTIRVSAAGGFELNGRSIELLGGNLHHDNGVLGAAAFDRAEERKVELMKAAGFNAVRTAHNPPSTAFLDACDRLGLLVVNEIFDGWEKAKSKKDYSVYFRKWWRRDVDAWVMRDRNHPSVVMWSTGNEMYERTGNDGYWIALSLASRIRELDSTRPLSAGVNGAGANGSWTQLDPVFSTLDIAGYNYELYQHAGDHARLPERVIMAAESYQSEALANWEALHDHAYVIGDFVWSAIDYLGEAGIGRYYPPGEEPRKHWEGSMFPWHGAYCGDIDLTGWRKPASHFRNIVWDRGEKLYATVLEPAPSGGAWGVTPWSLPPSLPSWTWPGEENKPLTIEVYSRHDAVRVSVNGRVVGEKPTTRAEGFKAVFTTPYEPGVVEISGLKAGKAVETRVLKTASTAAALRLTADRTQPVADGQDLVFVTVEALDAEGTWQPLARPVVKFSVEGAGSLAGAGTGDLTSFESYRGSTHTLFQGRALAVLRTTKAAGAITLTAEAPGLPPAKITVTAIAPSEN